MLLGNPHTLPSGLRIRLHLPLTRDLNAVVDLLARLGLTTDQLEVRRALRFDRRAPLVLATGLVDGHERMLGLAADGLRLADEDLAPGIGALLDAAVRERAAVRAA